MDRERVRWIAEMEMKHRREHDAREPGWLYFHGLRTAKIALNLRRRLRLEVSDDVLFAGAMFHDIGKGKPRHNVVGAEITRRLLVSCCEPGELKEICRLVEMHNHRDCRPSLPLAVQILQDADTLDHVGEIGVWLAFYYSGSRGETAQDTARFISGERNQQKRLKMRTDLHFPISVAMFDRRIRWEDAHFARFGEVYHGR